MSKSGMNSGNKEALQELLVDEMKDLYHSENQLIKALPKMAQAARDPDLKQSFQTHLKQTEGHAKRLEQAFQMLDEKAQAKTCKGMQGLLEEGEEEIEEGKNKEAFAADLGLITSAQKVEHYEISGYGSVRTMAQQIGKSDVARLLQQNEDEEKKTNELLTQAARPMLEQASM